MSLLIIDQIQTRTVANLLINGEPLSATAFLDIRGEDNTFTGTNTFSGDVSVSGTASFTGMPNAQDGDPIVDQGSNANGAYIRYASGAQVCWQSGIVNGGSTWTFPEPFISTDNLAVQVTPGSAVPRFAGYTSLSTSSVGLVAFQPNETASTASLSSTAYGFWK